MHNLRNIEIKIKTKIKQTWGLTEIATLKFRSKRNLPVKPRLVRPTTTRNGCQPPVVRVTLKLCLGLYCHSVWSPTYRRAIKEVSKAVNFDWINNQTCRMSQNIYIITNLLLTNNYLSEMIGKIIFTNYFSECIYQVAIKFRFWKALQKKCFQSNIIFRHFVKMPPINFWKRLTDFMISISLSKTFCCQNPITNIKIINMTRHSSFLNKFVLYLFTVVRDGLQKYCDSAIARSGVN